MTDSLLKDINEYASILKKASRWGNSEHSIAPVELRKDDRGIFYIYEFYCLIRVVFDLSNKYDMEFIPGEGEFEYKFPQASANKKGKPKFIFKKIHEKIFELYGGIHVKGKYECEEDHPDISFLLPSSPDDATENHLIMIMDAKFVSDSEKLSKTEVSVFESIVRRYNLTDERKVEIEFNELSNILGNTLLTNGLFHADRTKGLDGRLKENYIKEAQRFCPNETHEVAG